MSLEGYGTPARRRTSRAGEATRDRLLKVSLDLFSRHGIDDVSVRDICDKAQASTGAINYHFGSKSGLVEELLRRQATAVTTRREAMLDGLEAKSSVSMREIAEVFVLPMLDASEELGEPGTDAVFLSAAAGHPEYADLLSTLYQPGNSRLLALLERETPNLDGDIRMIRWAMAKDVVNHAAANPRSPFNLFLRYIGVDPKISIATALIDVIAASFEAPSSI